MRALLTALRDRVRTIRYFSPELFLPYLVIAFAVALIAWLGIQAIPWFFIGGPPTTVPYDVPVVEFGLGSVGVAALLLCLASALVLERGVRDRYEPWALVGLGLCLLGFAGCMRGALTIHAHGGFAMDLTVFRVAFAAFAAGMVCAVIAGVRLRGSPRRGRVFVLCTLALPPYWIVLVHTVLIDPAPLFRSWETDVALPRLSRADVLYTYDEWIPIVELSLEEGELVLRYEGVLSTPSELGRHLTECAARMEKVHLDTDHGTGPLVPDQMLLIRADERLPMRALLDVVEMCSREEVQIWRIGFETRFPHHPYPGFINAYLPKDPGNPSAAWYAEANEKVLEIDPNLPWGEFVLLLEDLCGPYGWYEIILTRIE